MSKSKHWLFERTNKIEKHFLRMALKKEREGKQKFWNVEANTSNTEGFEIIMLEHCVQTCSDLKIMINV